MARGAGGGYCVWGGATAGRRSSAEINGATAALGCKADSGIYFPSNPLVGITSIRIKAGVGTRSIYYLVRAGFEMHEMHEKNGRINPVPRLRTTAHNRENWHNKEVRFKWKMDNRVRQEALSKCGVNN